VESRGRRITHAHVPNYTSARPELIVGKVIV
jgi:hypothetical protein